MLGYAPQIRGYAKTNAKVEVRQQGNLIYQTTVTPGSFEINDLFIPQASVANYKSLYMK